MTVREVAEECAGALQSGRLPRGVTLVWSLLSRVWSQTEWGKWQLSRQKPGLG